MVIIIGGMAILWPFIFLQLSHIIFSKYISTNSESLSKNIASEIEK